MRFYVFDRYDCEIRVHSVRLKILTCDVTNYKKRHMSLTKFGKQKSNYTSSHCHERVVLFWFFQAFTLSLSLSLDGVSDELEEMSSRTKYMFYI